LDGRCSESRVDPARRVWAVLFRLFGLREEAFAEVFYSDASGNQEARVRFYIKGERDADSGKMGYFVKGTAMYLDGEPYFRHWRSARCRRTANARHRFLGASLPALSVVRLILTPTAEEAMARKTIRVSDRSGQEIPDGKGATVRITFADARKGVRELDLTDEEAESLGGRAVARRGRKPKGAATSG
jgi:hypothetical protein